MRGLDLAGFARWKKYAFAAALLFAVLPLFGQSRSSIRIFIPEPTGGVSNQREFFADQFKMEVRGAGYTVVDSEANSDYTLRLAVEDNPDYRTVAGAEQFNLDIRLLQSGGNTELIRFGFPFTRLDAMYNWNPYLVYQALGTVGFDDQPSGEPSAPPKPAEPEQWRNKWLYLNFAAGMDTVFFLRPGTMTTEHGMIMAAALAGLEFHFLGFLSLEADPLKIRVLHDGEKYLLTSCFPVLLKVVLKPGGYVMLEPYAGAEWTLAIPDFTLPVPRLSALAGLQLGLRAGKRELVTVDFNISYSLLGELTLVTGNKRGTLKFALLAGCKIGFFDRR